MCSADQFWCEDYTLRISVIEILYHIFSAFFVLFF